MLEKYPLRGPIDVHLKVNSGMNRLGFRPEQVAGAYARLRAVPKVLQIVLVTHFHAPVSSVGQSLWLTR